MCKAKFLSNNIKSFHWKQKDCFSEPIVTWDIKPDKNESAL